MATSGNFFRGSFYFFASGSGTRESSAASLPALVNSHEFSYRPASATRYHPLQILHSRSMMVPTRTTFDPELSLMRCTDLFAALVTGALAICLIPVLPA